MKNMYKWTLGIMGLIGLILMGIIIVPLGAMAGIVMIIRWFPLVLLFIIALIIIKKVFKDDK